MQTNLHETQNLNQDQWDYSIQAPFYQYRPNYTPIAIDQLLEVVGEKKPIQVLDVGAGTGNLTLLLRRDGVAIVAIEPNEPMRTIGKIRVHGPQVRWKAASAEKTMEPDESADLWIMGSSFNTTDRVATIREALRVLRPGGWFSCLWNHRELQADPIQATIEKIIRRFYPNYSHGTRREDQTPFLKKIDSFQNHQYFECPQRVFQSRENYLLAWRSVRNSYWDLRDPDQKNTFEAMLSEMEVVLPETLELTYVTRVWLCQKALVQ